MLDNPKSKITSEILIRFFEINWKPYFGKPDFLRVDAAGGWLSKHADEYFQNQSIILEPIPADAHWQLSAAEEAVDYLKSVWKIRRLRQKPHSMRPFGPLMTRRPYSDTLVFSTP